VPPLTVINAASQVAGNNPTGASSNFINTRGYCPDTSVTGARFTYAGFKLDASTGTTQPGGIVMDEWTGSVLQSLASTGVPMPPPRFYSRDTVMRYSGGVYSGSIAGLSVSKGWCKLDAELEVETAYLSNNNRAYAVLLGASGAYIATGSRVAVKVRNILDKSDVTTSTTSPVGLYVATSANIPATGLDVDLLDMSGVEYGTSGSSTDGNYVPYRIENSAHVGMIRFHRIHHPSANLAAYAGRKVPHRYITSASSPFAVTPWTEVVYCDTTSGPVTITLPKTTGGSSLLGEPLQRGRVPLRIIDAARTAGTNAITITPATGDKIDGGSASASITLSTTGASKTLIAQPGLPGWLSADASSAGGASWTMLSGNYYFVNSQQAQSTSSTLSFGALRATPFVVPSTIATAKLFAECSVGGDAASVFRMGIYADNGSGAPGALLVEGSTQPSTASAVGIETAASVLLSPGVLYWVAGVVQGSGTQPQLRTCSAGAMPDLVQIAQGASLPTAAQVSIGWSITGITGALPNPFGSGSPAASAPRIGIKVA
jgi:hypothetical protein